MATSPCCGRLSVNRIFLACAWTFGARRRLKRYVNFSPVLHLPGQQCCQAAQPCANLQPSAVQGRPARHVHPKQSKHATEDQTTGPFTALATPRCAQKISHRQSCDLNHIARTYCNNQCSRMQTKMLRNWNVLGDEKNMRCGLNDPIYGTNRSTSPWCTNRYFPSAANASHHSKCKFGPCSIDV